MAAKRKALGKGLSALIPEDLEKEDYERIREIDIDLISPNPNQPRRVFEQDKLDELTESIKKYCTGRTRVPKPARWSGQVCLYCLFVQLFVQEASMYWKQNLPA
jgi:hypothetical protein